MIQPRRRVFRYAIFAALLIWLTCYLLFRDREIPSIEADLFGNNHLPLSNVPELNNPLRESFRTSNLHSLQSADEFLPYFDLLPSLPNVTVGEAIGTCDYSEEELSTFVFDADAWWKLEPRPESELSPFRDEWQSFIRHGLIPWNKVSHRFDGAGIVALAGPHDQAMRLKAQLRVLRQQHDTTLPVEINYYGEELSEEDKAAFSEIYGDNLFFNDLSLPEQIWQTFRKPDLNYQLKTAAMVNSRFKEVLMLDSDNIPLVDPAALFQSQTYQTYGSVFWPDITRARPENPLWAISNTACRRDEFELETGQVLVDKTRLWYHLQLTAWLHTRPYWAKIVLGDKDMFRYAWHALQTQYGTPVKWITSIGYLLEQPFPGENGEEVHPVYCGHSYAQALPDHSSLLGHSGTGIAFIHGGYLKTVSAPLGARLRKLGGGVHTHYKRVPIEFLEDWSKVKYRFAPYVLRSGWYLNRTADLKPSELVSADDDFDIDGTPLGEEGLHRLELTEQDLESYAMCMDIDGIEPAPLSDLGWEMAGFDLLFQNAGGYWNLDQGHRWYVQAVSPESKLTSASAGHH